MRQLKWEFNNKALIIEITVQGPLNQNGEGETTNVWEEYGVKVGDFKHDKVAFILLLLLLEEHFQL